VSAALCGLLARHIWLTHEAEQGAGLYGVSMLFVLFAGGVYVFSLGYELNDPGRALRLTLIIAVLGVVALALMIGAFAALAWIRSGMGAVAMEKPTKTVLGLVSAIEGGTAAGDAPKHDPLDYLVTCKSCKRDFIPVPPDAVCPWCHTAYLSA
jgi:hypothetical protein